MSVAIVNEALALISERRINSLSDENERARSASELIDTLTPEFLEEFKWPEAQARVRLSPMTEVPAFGYTKQFRVPEGFISIIDVNDGDATYELEGDKILCSSDVLEIVYVKNVPITKLSALARGAFAALLAKHLAQKLRASESTYQIAENEYRTRLAKARQGRSAQKSPRSYRSRDGWNEARRGGDPSWRNRQ